MYFLSYHNVYYVTGIYIFLIQKYKVLSILSIISQSFTPIKMSIAIYQSKCINVYTCT